jgi:hypothetical protein
VLDVRNSFDLYPNEEGETFPDKKIFELINQQHQTESAQMKAAQERIDKVLSATPPSTLP